jgi:hypothetical protein
VTLDDRAPTGQRAGMRADPAAQPVLDCFTETAGRRGYRVADPAPLVCDDPTVPFTNATVTPFKPTLLGGGRVPPVALAQPCLRLRTLPDRARAFMMLGLMAPGGQLDQVTADGMGLLRDALPAGRVEVVYAEGDDDLAAAAAPHADAVLQAARDTPALRWQFGAGSLLVGRGLAVCWSPSPVQPRVLLASLVLVVQTVALTEHVEFAAGLEPIVALRQGVTPFHLEPFGSVRQLLVDERVPEAVANEIADLVVAASTAIAAGARPGNRGRDHAVRRLIGDARRLLEEHGPAEDRLDELLRLTGASADVRRVVAAEVDRSATHREQAGRAARAYVRRQRARGRDVSAQELYETFGVLPGSLPHDPGA